MAEPQTLPAGPFDPPLLAELHRRCFDAPDERFWDGAAVAGLLAAPGVVGLIRTVGPANAATPVGFALIRVASGEAEILSIGVVPEARRRGHGRALLLAAAAHARPLGAAAGYLEVAADNHAARALYHGGGFRQVGRRADYYRRRDGGADALVLRTRLGD